MQTIDGRLIKNQALGRFLQPLRGTVAFVGAFEGSPYREYNGPGQPSTTDQTSDGKYR